MLEADAIPQKLQTAITSAYNKIGRPFSKHDKSGRNKIIAARLNGKFNKKDGKLLARWKNAEGWTQLVQLNREFVRGDTEFTPYHLGPLEPETISMIPSLLEMLDYGLVSWQSQSAGTDGPQVRYAGCCDAPYWHIGKKMPYLSFLVPDMRINDLDRQLASRSQSTDSNCTSSTISIEESRLNNFYESLLKDEHIYVSILQYESLCRRMECIVKPVVRSTFPDDWHTHMVKEAETKEELEQIVEFEPKRIIDPHCACIIDSVDSDSNNRVRQVKPTLVHVLAKSYDEQDLPGHVLRLLKKAAIETYFEEEICLLMETRPH